MSFTKITPSMLIYFSRLTKIGIYFCIGFIFALSSIIAFGHFKNANPL